MEPLDGPRPVAGHGSRVDDRGGRGIRDRRGNVPGQRDHAAADPPARSGRGAAGGAPGERPSRPSRRLPRGLIAPLGVGDDQRLQCGADVLLRDLGGVGPAGRARRLRGGRPVWGVRRALRGWLGRGLRDRLGLALAPSAARRAPAGGRVARHVGGCRARVPAGAGRYLDVPGGRPERALHGDLGDVAGAPHPAARRCRASAPTTGWDRSHCCRSALRCRARWRASSAPARCSASVGRSASLPCCSRSSRTRRDTSSDGPVGASAELPDSQRATPVPSSVD